MTDRKAVLRHLAENAERPLKPKEIRVRKGRYAVPGRINLIVGRLQVTRGGHGFVIPDSGGDDLFVRASNLGNAYDGDHVAARVERRPRGQNPEGSIVRVLERARTRVVGLLHRSKRYTYLVPREGSLHRDVLIPPEARGGAREGDVVVARVTDWGSEHLDPAGEVIEVLGRVGDPGVDILAIVHSHELPADFPPDVLAEAEEIRSRATDGVKLEGREDFRESLTFTIDPVDAKDHDDAVSIQRLKKDLWRVGVHIADVSHHVVEDSAIDAEALRRGTSVYLVDRVLPMLPEALSGDLCSLRPGLDRLTLSIQFELNKAGEVLKTDLSASVIRSRYALSYEEAQAIVDGTATADGELKRALSQLRDLASTLRERRQARGSLDFDLPEARVVVNAAGEPTHVQRLMRLETHQLIEEFMILANESVARMAIKRSLPFIFRVHEPPDPERLDRLREFVSRLGLRLPATEASPRALQRLLAQVEGRPEEAIVSSLVLRSMKQARYSAELNQHFGLASHAYAHFTSPIRRYPDLMVHRILRRTILEALAVPESWSDRLASVALQSSVRERQAVEAERESVELKKIEYMERHLGDAFEGTVSGVTPYGLFVLLDDLLVEGLVHVSQLQDDYYHFLDEKHALVGEVRKRSYRLGDRLDVQVLSVDREAQKLDLGLAPEEVS
jgi:ribonuclease R